MDVHHRAGGQVGDPGAQAQQQLDAEQAGAVDGQVGGGFLAGLLSGVWVMGLLPFAVVRRCRGAGVPGSA